MAHWQTVAVMESRTRKWKISLAM